MGDTPDANTEATDAFGGQVGASSDVAASGRDNATSGAGDYSPATSSTKTDARLDEGLKQGGGS